MVTAVALCRSLRRSSLLTIQLIMRCTASDSSWARSPSPFSLKLLHIQMLRNRYIQRNVINALIDVWSHAAIGFQSGHQSLERLSCEHFLLFPTSTWASLSMRSISSLQAPRMTISNWWDFSDPLNKIASRTSIISLKRKIVLMKGSRIAKQNEQIQLECDAKWRIKTQRIALQVFNELWAKKREMISKKRLSLIFFFYFR